MFDPVNDEDGVAVTVTENGLLDAEQPVALIVSLKVIEAGPAEFHVTLIELDPCPEVIEPAPDTFHT